MSIQEDMKKAMAYDLPKKHKRDGLVEPSAFKRNIINSGKAKMVDGRVYFVSEEGTWVRFVDCPNARGMYLG